MEGGGRQLLMGDTNLPTQPKPAPPSRIARGPSGRGEDLFQSCPPHVVTYADKANSQRHVSLHQLDFNCLLCYATYNLYMVQVTPSGVVHGHTTLHVQRSLYMYILVPSSMT